MQSEEQYGGVIYIILVILILTYFVSGAALRAAKVHIIHESSITIITGLLLGLIFYLGFASVYEFDKDAVFYYILPPIVFKEGINLDRRVFASNFGSIFKFGVFGTVLVFVMMAAWVYMLATQDLIQNFHGST
jgi:sodium/hydrogen exchanger-like protein 6/7/sodium/hydrogen exchanger 8